MNFRGSIIIKSPVSVPRVIKRKDGTQIIFNEQKAAIDNGDDFPIPFRITLQEGQQPYAPGRYALDPVCLTVGDFDSLSLGRRIDLIPFPSAK